jgi:mono/diheme cytochrome c family protein/cytochrome c5
LRERGAANEDGSVNRALASTLLAAFALGALSCGNKPAPAPASSAAAAATSLPTATGEAEEPAGDAERGKALVTSYECSRCHEGTGTAAATFEKQCFTCHVKIISGQFKGPKGGEARWHDRVLDLKDVPSLVSSQKRFRRSWLVSFLLEPYDLRPRLGPTMPRLDLTREQARDIAAYLAAPDDPAARPDFTSADPARGRKLMEANGCASCHVFTGVPPLEGAAPVKPGEKALATGVQLAPDLAFARRRLKPEALIAWVSNPKAVKPDTAMPEFTLKPEDARDIAAYVLTTPLVTPDPVAAPPRLPLLDRKVGYDEVSTKVFRRTCWHCHGEPDYAAGDGGPGNTGGFGFKPRGISFVDYSSVAAGRLDDKNERHSLFEKGPDGTPRLVRALLARRDEEAGHPDHEVRGMPLGYPSLAPEDIQLMESWIAQGRPQ